MARPKKNNNVTVNEKEVDMTENAILDQEKENKEVILDSVQTEIDLARLELEKTRLEIEQKKHELELMRSNPRRELDPQESKLMEKQVSMSNEKSTLKEKIEKQKAYDSVLVTGRFMNRRAPGQPAKLCYIKYESDPVKWYTLEDGKTYTIPRGFADQLNGGSEADPCYYTPHFIQKPGEMDPNRPESAIHDVDTSNKKYAFTPVNF